MKMTTPARIPFGKVRGTIVERGSGGNEVTDSGATITVDDFVIELESGKGQIKVSTTRTEDSQNAKKGDTLSGILMRSQEYKPGLSVGSHNLMVVPDPEECQRMEAERIASL